MVRCGMLIAVAVLITGCRPESAPLSASSDAVQSKTESSRPDVCNLDGEAVDPFASEFAKATVLVFVTTDCPIANRYAPRLQRMVKEFEERGAEFWLVYPNRDDGAEKIRTHIEDYGHTALVATDHGHRLVELAGATVTPEAAVFDALGELRYCGRIDNWYAEFGKSRPRPTEHDLRDAIENVLTGRPIETLRRKAIGCYIPDRE